MDKPNAEELLKQEGFILWLLNSDTDSPWNLWYEQSNENKVLASQLRIALRQQPLTQIKVQPHELQALKARIFLSIEKTPVGKRRSIYLQTAKWAASILVVATLSLSFLVINGKNKVDVPFGKQLICKLPDGSQVRINAGSSIAYNSFLWMLKPSVTLQGEGFFYGNHQKGFGVKTTAGEVRVLGTQFNVYSRNESYRVQCFQGKIRVGVDFASKPTILHANEAFAANLQTRKTEKYQIASPHSTPGWTTGEFSYQKAHFTDVLNELERQFNIKITGKELVKNLTYTGYFNTNDINIALKMTLTPMGIDYEYSQNKIILNSPK